MLMPDVADLVEDEDLGAQPFTVRRRRGEWSEGEFKITGDETLTCVGIIQTPTSEDLSFFPEGERRRGTLAVYTKTVLHLTEGEDVSDDIFWRDEWYKIIRIDRWQDYGYNVAYVQKR